MKGLKDHKVKMVLRSERVHMGKVHRRTDPSLQSRERDRRSGLIRRKQRWLR